MSSISVVPKYSREPLLVQCPERGSVSFLLALGLCVPNLRYVAGATESEEEVIIGRAEVNPASSGAQFAIIGNVTAAAHESIGAGFPCRAVCGGAVVIGVPGVLYPLEYVSGHIA